MSDAFDPRQDEDAYWRSGREFVRLLIKELNEALKANRISAKKRKAICTSFVFSYCNFLDQQWFKPGGRTEYPLLCFSESFFDLDTKLDLSQINFPHKSVELHGMVHDEIDWFFDEMKEDGSAMITGDLGAETANLDLQETDSDSILPQPCWTCHGTGQCYCIRKGGGDPVGCPRCQGTGNCQHCGGTGRSRHA